MMFRINPSVVHIDAYTTLPAVDEFFPPKLAVECLPEWWKRMPSTVSTRLPNGINQVGGSIKRCDGFVDLYKHGFMIPLWTDLLLKPNADQTVSFKASGVALGNSHDAVQLGEEFNNYAHLKLISPWFIKEKTGVKFIWQSAFWNMQDKMNSVAILPGMLEFKYQNMTNINILMPKNSEQVWLKAGTELVHLVPLTDKKIKIHTHVISEQEQNSMFDVTRYPVSFLGGYKKRKRALQEKESKCPFGFGKK